MSRRRTLAFILATCAVAIATASRAETWTIAVAPYQYILTVGSSASPGFEHKGQLVGTDNSEKNLIVVGNLKNFIVMAQIADPDHPGHTRPLQCMFRTTNASAALASGTGSCGGKGLNWTAAIAGKPVDTAPPTLLAGTADPRQSAPYAALDAPARRIAEAATTAYMTDMKSMPYYTQLRDLGCLERQFLNIRLQRPGWSQQDIHEYISLTCIAPAQVLQIAEARCRDLYGPNSAIAVRHPDSFCSCYAKNYAEAFVAKPGNSNQYESDLGVAAARACRMADGG